MSTLQYLISIGFAGASSRYIITATQALYYYDYFLTLSDEVEYAWAGRKTWIFFLFFLNRYFPALYQIWVFFVNFLPQFTHRTCDKTAFLEILSFFLCTLLAQASLTLRLYALTRKNKWVVIFFSAISLAQFLVGMYMVGITARKPAEQMPDIPLDAYRLCMFAKSRRFELVYVALSTFFDVMTFFVTVYVSFEAGFPPRGTILRTIVRDVTVYFFGIFIINMGSLVDLSHGASSNQVFAPLGTLEIVLVPLMISRMMLSLKKASRVEVRGWTTDALSRTHPKTLAPMEFGRPFINPQESSGITTTSVVVLSDSRDSLQVERRKSDGGIV